jgi:hypothetical protein
MDAARERHRVQAASATRGREGPSDPLKRKHRQPGPRSNSPADPTSRESGAALDSLKKRPRVKSGLS